jgi:hypothetical protein
MLLIDPNTLLFGYADLNLTSVNTGSDYDIPSLVCNLKFALSSVLSPAHHTVTTGTS